MYLLHPVPIVKELTLRQSETVLLQQFFHHLHESSDILNKADTVRAEMFIELFRPGLLCDYCY